MSIRPNMKLRREIQWLHMTTHNNLTYNELIIQYISYFDWPILLCLDLSATDTWMEKLIKKKQKKDGNLTPSLSISNIDSNDDPFKEITHWFKTKWLDRIACLDLIAWWGYVFSLIILRLILMFTLLASIWISNPLIDGTQLLGHSSNIIYRRALIFYVSMDRWPTSRLHAPTQIWQSSETACWVSWWLDKCWFRDYEKICWRLWLWWR